jgi:nicotinate-nucleotide pyrophosphorylase (carboxylating)
VSAAVLLLRKAYGDPPIEVECRTLEEVREAVRCGVSRIMLDNMLDKQGPEMMQQALDMVPRSIEVEASGGVTLENIALVAATGGERKADFVSVGRLTHSAVASDFSMMIM